MCVRHKIVFITLAALDILHHSAFKYAQTLSTATEAILMYNCHLAQLVCKWQPYDSGSTAFVGSCEDFSVVVWSFDSVL